YMCGNGLRCLALFAINRELVDGPAFSVATAAGLVSVDWTSAAEITIDLGKPELVPQRIPLNWPEGDRFVRQPISVSENNRNRQLQATCVSMGNPHCVIF